MIIMVMSQQYPFERKTVLLYIFDKYFGIIPGVYEIGIPAILLVYDVPVTLK